MQRVTADGVLICVDAGAHRMGHASGKLQHPVRYNVALLNEQLTALSFCRHLAVTLVFKLQTTNRCKTLAVAL
jgi:hypothetical protein